MVGHKFFMRADDWSIVGPTARGRDSVRISSQTAYDEAVFVLDLQHMPYGCATWPAFWTLSQQGPWPTGGEIDIIEGKHARTISVVSLPLPHPNHSRTRTYLPSHRCQSEREKPSHLAYSPRVHDAL